MSISFDRSRVQVEYERIIGADSPETINGNLFKTHQLTYNEVFLLKQDLDCDAVDYFYSGLISLFEGINGALYKHYSWATVKLYYSIYYFLRTSMAAHGYALIRCKSMFRLKLEEGESPYKTGNKKYNTTHEGTISHYIDVFESSDVLLSNKIDDLNAYDWMKNVREIVNYRAVRFMEPGVLSFWEYYDDAIDNDVFEQKVNTIMKPENLELCFLSEYAVIAIPVICMMQTFKLLKEKYIYPYEDCRSRCVYLKDIMHSQKLLDLFYEVLSYFNYSSDNSDDCIVEL